MCTYFATKSNGIFAKIVGNRQVLCRSRRILFFDFYRYDLPVFFFFSINYRKILVVTYGLVNSTLGYRGCRIFRSLIGVHRPDETCLDPFDRLFWTLTWLVKCFSSSISLLGFLLDFSLDLFSIFFSTTVMFWSYISPIGSFVWIFAFTNHCL